MGGGDCSNAIDASYAKMIYDIERISLNDGDFERRLALFHADPSIARDILLAPVVKSVPAPGVNRSMEVSQSKICCICKANVDHKWVSLPACEDTHTFCVPCAERCVFTASHNLPRFVCKICKNHKNLAPNAGVTDITHKQHGKGISFEEGICPFHGDILLYLCFDCLEAICSKCQTGFHEGHSFETLDTAYNDIKNEVGSLEKEVAESRDKASQDIEGLLGAQTAIENEKAQKEAVLIQQFAILRQELDRKEEEMRNAIYAVADNRTNALEKRMISLTATIDSCDNAKQLLREAQEKFRQNDAMKFIQFVTDKKELIQRVIDDDLDDLGSPSLKIDRPFPFLTTSKAKEAIRRMNYSRY